jgi:hypothetical protein
VISACIVTTPGCNESRGASTRWGLVRYHYKLEPCPEDSCDWSSGSSQVSGPSRWLNPLYLSTCARKTLVRLTLLRGILQVDIVSNWQAVRRRGAGLVDMGTTAAEPENGLSIANLSDIAGTRKRTTTELLASPKPDLLQSAVVAPGTPVKFGHQFGNTRPCNNVNGPMLHHMHGGHRRHLSATAHWTSPWGSNMWQVPWPLD